MQLVAGQPLHGRQQQLPQIHVGQSALADDDQRSLIEPLPPGRRRQLKPGWQQRADITDHPLELRPLVFKAGAGELQEGIGGRHHHVGEGGRQRRRTRLGQGGIEALLHLPLQLPGRLIEPGQLAKGAAQLGGNARAVEDGVRTRERDRVHPQHQDRHRPAMGLLQQGQHPVEAVFHQQQIHPLRRDQRPQLPVVLRHGGGEETLERQRHLGGTAQAGPLGKVPLQRPVVKVHLGGEGHELGASVTDVPLEQGAAQHQHSMPLRHQLASRRQHGIDVARGGGGRQQQGRHHAAPCGASAGLRQTGLAWMWTRWMWRAERAVNPSRPCSRPRLSAITTSPPCHWWA